MDIGEELDMMSVTKYQKMVQQTVLSRKIREYEVVEAFSVALQYVIINKERLIVYIYGMGVNIHLFVKLLLHEGVEIEGILDVDSRKHGGDVYGIRCFPPENCWKSENNKKAFVFIWTTFDDNEFGRLRTYDLLGGAICFDMEKHKNEIFARTTLSIYGNRIPYYIEHLKDLTETIEFYADDESKSSLIEFLRAFVENDTYRLNQIETRYKYFFGHEGEDLYVHKSSGAWINCGANVGDTIFCAIRNGLAFNRIYAVDSNPRSIRALDDNVKYLLDAEWQDRIRSLCCTIDGNTHVENWLMNGEEVSLINADIEGNEMEMLIALQDVISIHRPVVAVCVYHKASDLVEIPKFIKEKWENYILKLRKYQCHSQNMNQTYELVLYAIPKERSLGY